jgi:hypothetical protein
MVMAPIATSASCGFFRCFNYLQTTTNGKLSDKTQAPKSINSNHFNKSKQKQNLKRIVIFRSIFPTIPRNQTKTEFKENCYISLQHSNHSIKSVLLGIDQASPVAIH